MLANDGRLLADKQIRLRAATSVLGYEPGDVIAVREEGFDRLARAFFEQILARYVD